MALAIDSGSNDFSYLNNGVPQPRANQARICASGTAVQLQSPYGNVTIPMAGTTVNGVAYTAASSINAFYSALVDVTLQGSAGGASTANGGGTDSTGGALPAGFDHLEQNFTYNAAGKVVTIAKISGANTYTQTFTYTDGNVTNISKWVKS